MQGSFSRSGSLMPLVTPSYDTLYAKPVRGLTLTMASRAVVTSLGTPVEEADKRQCMYLLASVSRGSPSFLSCSIRSMYATRRFRVVCLAALLYPYKRSINNKQRGEGGLSKYLLLGSCSRSIMCSTVPKRDNHWELKICGKI